MNTKISPQTVMQMTSQPGDKPLPSLEAFLYTDIDSCARKIASLGFSEESKGTPLREGLLERLRILNSVCRLSALRAQVESRAGVFPCVRCGVPSTQPDPDRGFFVHPSTDDDDDDEHDVLFRAASCIT